MNKTHSGPICILVPLVVILAGCTNPTEQLTAQTQNANNNAEQVLVDWAYAYSFEELVWNADLIIEGTIAGIQETRLEHQIENVSAGEIYTDYKVDISMVLKAYPGFLDRSVVIKHFGGTYQGRTQVVHEDEPYQSGEKVFLFLRDISIFPGQTRPDEIKYSVLMPGGRFRIMTDGKLDTPTKNFPVAETFRGKDKSILEKDILTRLPTPPDYLQREVERSSLIVEGTVGQVQNTFTRPDLTPEQIAQAKVRGELQYLVYTSYAFTVDQVLEDKLARYQDHPYWVSVYQSTPVNTGDVIALVESGGTYEGSTLGRTSVPFLKPGDKMFLFLSATACGQRYLICNWAEQEANKILYMPGSNRFIIGSDHRLITLTPGPISRFYTGQAKSQLEQDIAAAKVNWEKALEEEKNRPTPLPPPFPPPPTPVPPTPKP